MSVLIHEEIIKVDGLNLCTADGGNLSIKNIVGFFFHLIKETYVKVFTVVTA